MVHLSILMVMLVFGSVSQAEHCQISERIGNTTDDELCSGSNPDQECNNYCWQTFKASMAECHTRNNRHQCICFPKCMLGEVFGDPHYGGFDGFSFSHQGLCKYVAFAMMEKKANLPTIELLFTNKPLSVGSSASFPSSMELRLPELGLVLELDSNDFALQINDDPVAYPFLFSTRFGKIENKLSVVRSSSYVNITTNFGLKIVLHAPKPDWRDFFVYLARIPQFTGNIAGILGNGDGHRANDFVDRFGIQRDPRNQDSLDTFANSWCIDEAEVPSHAERQTAAQIHEAKLNQCKATSKNRIDGFCSQLRMPKLVQCFSDEELKIAFDQCFMDVCYMGDDGEEEALVSAIVEAYIVKCDAQN